MKIIPFQNLLPLDRHLLFIPFLMRGYATLPSSVPRVCITLATGSMFCGQLWRDEWGLELSKRPGRQEKVFFLF